ncbi:MAG TPA: TadE/TadG family type IV pilus assembly protein [Lichenihabitans sp.]|nr:TadE/TadG family type IV pilus assembly protein [Lichenihabitans sp.]
MTKQSILRRFQKDPGATSAVEFAMIAPCFILLVFGILSFGTVFGIYHGVQQLASEAARASVAGLSDTEADQIARSFVAANVGSYAFLDPADLTVSTSAGSGSSNTFKVSIRYDMSSLFVFGLSRLLPMPAPLVQRTAVIQRGGY